MARRQGAFAVADILPRRLLVPLEEIVHQTLIPIVIVLVVSKSRTPKDPLAISASLIEFND